MNDPWLFKSKVLIVRSYGLCRRYQKALAKKSTNCHFGNMIGLHRIFGSMKMDLETKYVEKPCLDSDTRQTFDWNIIMTLLSATSLLTFSWRFQTFIVWTHYNWFTSTYGHTQRFWIVVNCGISWMGRPFLLSGVCDESSTRRRQEACFGFNAKIMQEKHSRCGVAPFWVQRQNDARETVTMWSCKVAKPHKWRKWQSHIIISSPYLWGDD